MIRFSAPVASADLRLAARLRRFMPWATLAALMVLALAVVNATPAAAAPARSVNVSAQGAGDRNLIVAGSYMARRRDHFILYLARRCASTIGAARRGHYIIARGRVERSGREWYRAMIARSEVRPRSGRACYLIADSRGRAKTSASAAYRMR
jgi:hypothetical protein